MPSRRSRITKRVVDALNPGEIVWDEDVRGFGVRCQRRNKTYVLKTRIGGRQRWFTIGTHGSPWTAEKARMEAKAILGEVAANKDPATQRDAEARAFDVARLAERWLAEEVDPKLRSSTAVLYRDLLDRIVIPRLGKLRVKQVNFDDVSRLHHELRDTPYSANRVLAVLSSMFRWAERIGQRERQSNPCSDVRKYRESARERFLSPSELGRLGEALDAHERMHPTSYAVAAIRLLIFTGARLGEVLALRWEDVDLDNAMLTLPDSKTGKKSIYLNAPAIKTLSGIPRLHGNPYVICGQRVGRPMVNLRKPWLSIRKTAGLEDVRIHDLRHSFASVGASGGATLQIIGKLLGHTQIDTTQRYAHLSNDPVRAANEAIGTSIDAMMKGEQADVVRLSGRS